MLINNQNYMQTNQFSYCNTQNTCNTCPKRYNCISYLIHMVEQLNNSSASEITPEIIATIINDNNKILLSELKNSELRLKDIQEKSSQELFKYISKIANEFETYHNDMNNKLDIILNILNDTCNNTDIEVLNKSENSQELSISAPEEKVYKEKKTIFGKTKWVEDK